MKKNILFLMFFASLVEVTHADTYNCLFSYGGGPGCVTPDFGFVYDTTKGDQEWKTSNNNMIRCTLTEKGSFLEDMGLVGCGVTDNKTHSTLIDIIVEDGTKYFEVKDSSLSLFCALQMDEK